MDPNIFEGWRKTAEQIGNAVQSANKFGEQIAKAMEDVRSIALKFNETTAPIIKSFNETRDWFQKLDKAGLTPNLGEGRTHRNLEKYKKLLSMGYAIFWVPREEIVNKLLGAGSEKDRKGVITSSKTEILEDCKNAIDNVNSRFLKDTRLHLESAIDSMQQANYRAAQSTASVCFDSLLDQIIDTSSLSSFKQLSGKINGDTAKLKNIDKLPIQYLYAAFQSQLIIYSLRGFERLRPMTVQTKYGRHSSIHSVSSRQYNEFNALQAIMITTSLLATTEKLGKGWITELSNIV